MKSETHAMFIAILLPTLPNLEANLGSTWAPRRVQNGEKMIQEMGFVKIRKKSRQHDPEMAQHDTKMTSEMTPT